MVTKRTAVKNAQVILRATDDKLVADGWWGSTTEGVFQRSSNIVKQDTVQSLARDGYTVESVRMRNVGGAWISEDRAVSLAERAALQVGVPASAMRYFLRHEPAVRVINGQREYKVDSRSPGGSYYGLFQMGRDAWTDAQRLTSEIGPFTNWTDPWLNALAAASFIKVNMGYARDIHKYNGPFTDEILYGMHNQGHTFLSSARQGGAGQWFDGQSAAAKRTLLAAARVVRSA